MVREDRGAIHKVRSFHFRKIFDRQAVHNLFNEQGREAAKDEKAHPRNEVGSSPLPLVTPSFSPLAEEGEGEGEGEGEEDAAAKPPIEDRNISDVELMKERFSKLLLGEDMSGGGKGVSSALALSNAVTNIAASVFGEQKRLEPMDPERKARWKKEIDWLLSVTDYIVEFIPCQQKSKDGLNMEIMMTQQRRDLRMNVPALRKLDKMLMDTLDNFADEQEFTYVSRDAAGKGIQMNDKWWLPNVKVPPCGLSGESQQFLLKQKEAVNQVLKASMAINAQILSDMEIPDNYLESLPKHGRESLGVLIYRSITDESFNPTEFLSSIDLSSEHNVVDLKNRIEASVVIWKRKMHHKDGKSSWASAISYEKRELIEERAETILLLLKQKFPGIPQSSLEISKIQYNRDIGLAIMESYSRVLETLANTVLSRIQDVLHADSLTQDPLQQLGDSARSPTLCSPLSPEVEPEKCSSTTGTPTSKTLSDFMGWDSGPPQMIVKKDERFDEEKIISKPPKLNSKKFSYLDKIEMSILRSPTARH